MMVANEPGGGIFKDELRGWAYLPIVVISVNEYKNAEA